MGLEAGTYISDLIVTNPGAGDGKNEGDDHLRLIKACLKNTFPNIAGIAAAGHADLAARASFAVAAGAGWTLNVNSCIRSIDGLVNCVISGLASAGVTALIGTIPAGFRPIADTVQFGRYFRNASDAASGRSGWFTLSAGGNFQTGRLYDETLIVPAALDAFTLTCTYWAR